MKYLVIGYFGLGNLIQTVPMLNKINNNVKVKKIYYLDSSKVNLEYISLLKLDKINVLQKENIYDLKNFILTNQINHIIFPFASAPSWKIINSIFFSKSQNIYFTRTIFGSKLKQRLIIKVINIFSQLLRPSRKFIKFLNKGHNVEVNLRLIGGSSFKEISNYTTKYFLEYDILNKYSLEKKKYICFQVSAADGIITSKRWPINYFINLFEILSKHSHKIVLIGSLKDKLFLEKNNFYKKINNANINRDKIIDLHGLDIKNTMYLFKYTNFLICHDSGLMHLGDFVNCDGYALIGPTDISKSRPLSKKFEVISLNKNCSPCISLEKWNDNESFFNCPYDKSCMKEILPIQVYNTIKKKL